MVDSVEVEHTTFTLEGGGWVHIADKDGDYTMFKACDVKSYEYDAIIVFFQGCKNLSGPQVESKQPINTSGPDHYTRLHPEPLDVIEAWGLDKDHCLATAIKYISRAYHKSAFESDVIKAIRYLARRIGRTDIWHLAAQEQKDE